MNIPALNGNWVDLVIILVLVYFISEAWRHGFWVLLADFLSFLGSLFLALRGYQFASSFLQSNFSISRAIANALGFLLTAVLAEAFLGFIFAHLISRFPEKFWKSKYQRYLGVIPGLGEGLVLVAFILTFVLSLPISPQLKVAVAESKIGGSLVKETSGIERRINEIFGGAVEESLTYFTVKPGSREKVPLNIEVGELTIDQAAEARMRAEVNSEREKRGLNSLVFSAEMTNVARGHARDMWERKYFSHYSPEGKDVGDRLSAAGVSYSFAGENLALAPTVETAMTGLMNSEGHRANILEPKFRKIGVGVIDNGYWGKMFVQVFSD